MSAILHFEFQLIIIEKNKYYVNSISNSVLFFAIVFKEKSNL